MADLPTPVTRREKFIGVAAGTGTPLPTPVTREEVYLKEIAQGLAGTPVTGVKGDAEADFRKGNVNITAEDIGFAAVTASEAEAIWDSL